MGQWGNNGDDGLPGDEGKDGNLETRLVDVSLFNDYYSTVMNLEFAELCCYNAENLYQNSINDGYKEIYSTINWLYKILNSDLCGTNFPADGSDKIQWSDGPSANHNGTHLVFPKIANNSAKLVSIRERIKTLLFQLQSGVDYWGNDTDYVTLLSKDYIDRDIETLYAPIAAIEADYNAFVSTEISFADHIAILKRQKNNYAGVLQNKIDLSIKTKQDANEILKTITTLADGLSRLDEIIRKDMIVFQNAVETYNNKCKFKDIVDGAKLLISVGKAVEGDYTGIVTAVGSVQDMTSRRVDPTDDFNNVLQKVITVGQDINRIEDDLNDAYTQLKKLDLRQNALILITEENYKKITEPYLNIAETANAANNLRNDFENYLTTIQNINEGKINYTHLVLDAKRINNEIQDIQNIISNINWNSLTLQNEISSDVVYDLISKMYLDTVNFYKQLVYLENKAYNYWALDNRVVSFSTNTIDGVAAEHIKIKKIILSKMDQRSQLAQIIGSQQTIDVRLNEKDYPIQFNLFKTKTRDNNYQFTINIPADHPSFINPYWREIYATSLTVQIPNYSSINMQLYMKVVNMGNSTVIDVLGKPHKFNHHKVGVSLTSDGTKFRENTDTNLFSPNSLNEDYYVGVSPFATWYLEVADSPGLDLSKISEIIFSFRFIFRTPL